MSTSSGAPLRSGAEGSNPDTRLVAEIDGHVSSQDYDKAIDSIMKLESEEEYRFIVTRVPEVFLATYATHDCPNPQDFHVEMQYHWVNNQRTVTLAPAQHGKTTGIKWRAINEICANPNVRIILVGKNEAAATRSGTDIRDELEYNEKLIEDFGDFRSAKWGQQFNVKQRRIQDRSPTFAPYGWNGRYLGERCDIIFCDDIVDEKNSETEEQRKKLIERFQAAARTCPQMKWPLRNPECDWSEFSANMMVPQGIDWPADINYVRVIVTGTRFHNHDLYRTLAGDRYLRGGDPTYKPIYFDCWRDKEETKPLWPDVWTAKRLHDEAKSLTLRPFNCRFRNIPIDVSEVSFRDEWVYGGEYGNEEFPGCLNRNRSLGQYPEGLYKILGFDPASGTVSKYASVPSFMLLGYDKESEEEDRKRYICDLYSLTSTDIDDLIDVFLDGNARKGIPGYRRKHEYDMLVVETNGYGTFFNGHRRVKDAENNGLIVKPHWTQGNKTDPMDGILTMQGIFKNGLVDIPYADDGVTQEKVNRFLEQLLEYPQGLTDFLLAFWFAELWIRKNTQAQGVVTRNTPGKRFQTSNYWNRPSL